MEQKVIKRMIVLCWVFLLICFLIKLFGGNIFEIVVENEKFIDLCKFVDKSIIAKYVIGCMSSFISISLFLLAICRKWWFDKKSEKILVALTIFVGVAVKLYNENIGLFVDCWQLIPLPMILLGKPSLKWINIIIANVFNLAFQFLSMFIRDPNIIFLKDNMLIGLVMCIDLYIMLGLYYIYSNLKGETMSIFFNLFFCKDITRLEAFKNVAKSDRLKAIIQKRIDKLKAEENTK